MIIQSLKDAGKWTEELKDAMDDAYSIEDLEDALYELDISVSYYEEYPVDSGIFFTHEAAVQHLKSNDYHYGAEAHTYAETAWRSREERLWNILQTVDWSKIQIKAE